MKDFSLKHPFLTVFIIIGLANTISTIVTARKQKALP